MDHHFAYYSFLWVYFFLPFHQETLLFFYFLYLLEERGTFNLDPVSMVLEISELTGANFP